MSFSHPDQAVRQCHIAEESACAASRSIAAHGRHYDFLCPRCRRHKTIEVYNSEARELIMRCARCMLPRPWTDAYVLGGHAHSGRGGLPPRALIIAGDLAIVKGVLDEMVMTTDLGPGYGRVYMAWVVSGRSQEWVAIDASSRGVEGRSWSAADVKRVVRVCRSWLQRKLKSKGLFKAARAQERRCVV